MAYRDDLEALNAQVRTLKAELEAARQARTAAQAAARAARAAADEAALIAKQSGAPPPTADGARRWLIIAVSLGTLAVAVAGYLSFKLMTAGNETEMSHARMLREEARARDLQRLVKQGEEERARLAATLAITQRRCQRPSRYGQRGHGGGQHTSARGGLGAPTAPGALPETLSRSQIQAGMRSVKDAVQGCYDRYKVPGLANVQVVIGRTGVVQTARVKGMFAQTPTGTCVARALRRARFPRFSGSPVTITYPFILR